MIKRTLNDQIYKYFRLVAARNVREAIGSGMLFKPDYCSICQKTCKPHAHHPDYREPLTVKWVCKVCHQRLHKMVFTPPNLSLLG